MKTIVRILVLFFAFTLSMQAQKKQHHKKLEKLSVDQKANLMVKKLTLKLDLSQKQQQNLKPLLVKKLSERKALKEMKKKTKKSKTKLSANERYAIMNSRLEKQIAFKKELKQILNKEQFEKFENLIAKKSKKYRRMKLKKHHHKMKKKRV